LGSYDGLREAMVIDTRYYNISVSTDLDKDYEHLILPLHNVSLTPY